MKSVRLAIAAPIALLAACGDEAPQEGEVSGEVLEGTISDEMLPLEQVRSRGPLAEPTATGGGASADAPSDEPAPAEETTQAEPDTVPVEPED